MIADLLGRNVDLLGRAVDNSYFETGFDIGYAHDHSVDIFNCGGFKGTANSRRSDHYGSCLFVFIAIQELFLLKNSTFNILVRKEKYFIFVKYIFCKVNRRVL
jgi:hypothetical protein